MAQIGRRIFYELETGNVIVDTGERAGFVVPTTVEQDFQTYAALAERVPETIGVLELEYGQYAKDFAICNGFRVNPETKQLEFSYPDPNEQEPQEPVYQRPLSEEVAETKQAIAELTILIAQMGGM